MKEAIHVTINGRGGAGEVKRWKGTRERQDAQKQDLGRIMDEGEE